MKKYKDITVNQKKVYLIYINHAGAVARALEITSKEIAQKELPSGQ